MQDFFFVGLISALALAIVVIKGITAAIHFYYLKDSNAIIEASKTNIRLANHEVQQKQSTLNSIDTVNNWKMEDPRYTQDLRNQFLTKTKTRRTPTSYISDRVSPRDRVPLASTDFDVSE